jgi:hypothetical protein
MSIFINLCLQFYCSLCPSSRILFPTCSVRPFIVQIDLANELHMWRFNYLPPLRQYKRHKCWYFRFRSPAGLNRAEHVAREIRQAPDLCKHLVTMMPTYLIQPWIPPLGMISNRSRLSSHHGNYKDIESLTKNKHRHQAWPTLSP